MQSYCSEQHSEEKNPPSPRESGGSTHALSFARELRKDPLVAAASVLFLDRTRVDLATANGSSSDVSVLLGNGDGTFKDDVRFAAGGGARALVAADIDGDGRVDLATANNGSNDISVLSGNGDGTFKAQTRFAAGREPWGIIAADLDGDGRIDLATANHRLGDISVLFNEFPPADRAPPLLRCPGPIRSPCTGPDGALVDFSVTAEDDCDPLPLITCDFPPGTVFPPGTTIVTCTAQDASGNRSQCSFEVEAPCAEQLPGDCNQDGKLNISDPINLTPGTRSRSRSRIHGNEHE